MPRKDLEERRAYAREYMARYRATEEGKAKSLESRRRYEQSEKGKGKQRERHRIPTEASRARSREWQARNRTTEEGRMRERQNAQRFWNSEKGQAARERAYERRMAERTALPADYMRVCKNCGVEKPISNFKKSWLGSQGYESKCKDCVRGSFSIIQKKSRTLHWNTVLAYGARQRSKSWGKPCDIDAAFISHLFETQKGLCYWFGIAMLPDAPNYHPQKPSLERLDRSLGYTKDNVVLACYAANMGRNDTSHNAFLTFVEKLRRCLTTSTPQPP